MCVSLFGELLLDAKICLNVNFFLDKIPTLFMKFCFLRKLHSLKFFLGQLNNETISLFTIRFETESKILPVMLFSSCVYHLLLRKRVFFHSDCVYFFCLFLEGVGFYVPISLKGRAGGNCCDALGLDSQLGGAQADPCNPKCRLEYM